MRTIICLLAALIVSFSVTFLMFPEYGSVVKAQTPQNIPVGGIVPNTQIDNTTWATVAMLQQYSNQLYALFQAQLTNYLTVSSFSTNGAVLFTNIIVDGVLYTNTSSKKILLNVPCSTTPNIAGVLGSASISVEVPGYGTNVLATPTLLGIGITGVSNQIVQYVPPGYAYMITNRSSGSGNSAKISGVPQMLGFQ